MSRYLGRASLVAGMLVCFAFPFFFPALSIDDSSSYLNPAREWAAGRGLREGNGAPLQYRLPAYPLLLGLTFRIAGESPLAIGVLNAVLHALSIFLVLKVLPAGPRSDLLCAFALVYPPLLTSTGLVLQESLIACTLAALFAATTHALRPAAHPAWGLAAGLALGASALAKTTVLPAGFLLLVLLWRSGVSRRHALGFIAGATLVIAPWMVRNRLELGRFQIASGNAGVNLFAGTVGNLIMPSWDTFPEYLEARAGWEAEGRLEEPVFDRYLARLAIERIAADPTGWMALAVERVFRFMLPARHWFVAAGFSQTGSAGLAYLGAIAIQMLLYGACALLLIRGLRPPLDASALVSPMIVFSHVLVYAASHASPRYGATVGPLLFAALVLVTLPLGPRPDGGLELPPRFLQRETQGPQSQPQSTRP